MSILKKPLRRLKRRCDILNAKQSAGDLLETIYKISDPCWTPFYKLPKKFLIKQLSSFKDIYFQQLTIEKKAKVVINYFNVLMIPYGGYWFENINPYITECGFSIAIKVLQENYLLRCQIQKNYSFEHLKNLMNLDDEYPTTMFMESLGTSVQRTDALEYWLIKTLIGVEDSYIF